MHPVLYEINTRVWRQRFGENTQLLDIPISYWQQLASLGVDYVWLMGVWQTGPNIHHYALDAGLQREYQHVLPNWSEADVIGSPYAIDRYVLHADLGKEGDLQQLKARLNELGLRLVLDFIPNHFHAESSLLAERPDIFLEVDPGLVKTDSSTFYHPPILPDRAFAHGKDPYFTAWQDTVQVNYTALPAQKYMSNQLLDLAELCDGLRCDMAMLPLSQVMQQTWGYVLGDPPADLVDFWPAAIKAVKDRHPDFCFLAEVYWDMEWTLQQQGFDYTYDKRLLDRLHQADSQPISAHLQADLAYQYASARFLENHDEDRVLSFLSPDQAQAAALITYTIPGLRFFYQGQWEGRRLRLPVQLGREPQETLYQTKRLLLGDIALSQLPGFSVVDAGTTIFYERLLQLLCKPALKKGDWFRVDLKGDNAHKLLAWQWTWKNDRYLIVVNYQLLTVDAILPQNNDNGWQHFGTNQLAASQERLLPFGYLILEEMREEE